MSTGDTLLVPRRFNGPADSGNGGYTCGLVAELIDGDAEITLRSPPPLDTALQITPTDEGLEIRDGDTLVATARGIEFEPVVPPVIPSWAEAVEAARHYLGHERHEFPTCFTCGTRRSDGLAIFPGPLGGGVVAAPWIPDESLPGRDGVVAPPIAWAALDCPGAWAEARDFTEDPVLLGRMSARITEPVVIGRRYVAMAWKLGEEGRKSYASTALVDDDGATVAEARQVWVAVGK